MSDESFTGEIGYKYMIVIIALALIVIGIVGAIIYYGLVKIPASPPEVALVTFLGERIHRVKKEGWRFFFGYPYIFSYIPIEVTKLNQEFIPNEVRTPDNAEIKVPVSITWQPQSLNPEALIIYINTGGQKGVENILQSIVSERIRQWARSLEEGPQSWEEAQAAGEKAVEVILEAILGRDVTDEEMKECRRGTACLNLQSLGIIINRLNVGQIEVLGTIAEAAEKAAKETQEKKAEIVELDHVKERVKIFTNAGFTPERALEIVQTERGKVSKTISEHKISISTEVGETLKEIVPAFLSLAGLTAKDK